MKLNKLLIAALAVILILGSALPAMAQDHGKRPCGPPPLDLTMLVEDLNLSESQKEPVKAILNKYQTDQKDLLTNLREARQELCSVVFAKEFKEDAVRQAFQKKSSVMEKLVVSKAKMISELRTVLDTH